MLRGLGVSAAELGAGDGCGDGYIETLGGVVLTVAGDEQAAVHLGPDLWRDAIAFVAHHDESVRGERLGIDIVAIEQGAIDGVIGWQAFDEVLQIYIYNVYARDASHGGLYYLRIPGIDGVFATVDLFYAKPVGYADDGAEVAGILDAVEGQGEVRIKN